MSETSTAGLIPNSNRSAPTEVEELLVSINDIVVPPDRARKDYKQIRELADSIQAIGLMHPLFCKKLEDGKYQLVGGGRRYRALMALGWKQIPIRLGKELTELEIKVAELAENVDRDQLSWPEQLENLRQIHELSIKQYGAGGAGQASTSLAWNQNKTAEMTGESKSQISTKLKLANTLNARPDIKKMVSDLPMSAAMRRTAEILDTEALHKKHSEQKLEIRNELKLGDARELIKSISSDTVDLLLNDPPFGMNELQDSIGETLDTNANYTAFLKETDNLSFADSCSLLQNLLPEYYRVMKHNAHGYIFASMELYRDFLFQELRKVGFTVPEQPVIWYKGRQTTNFTGNDYPSSYEVICFFQKPGLSTTPARKLLNPKLHNVLTHSPLSAQKKIHRFQKPSELIVALIENSSRPGELVLDPTAGSGIVVKMAAMLKRNVIGFEYDSDNFVRAQAFLVMP